MLCTPLPPRLSTVRLHPIRTAPVVGEGVHRAAPPVVTTPARPEGQMWAHEAESCPGLECLTVALDGSRGSTRPCAPIIPALICRVTGRAVGLIWQSPGAVALATARRDV